MNAISVDEVKAIGLAMFAAAKPHGAAALEHAALAQARWAKLELAYEGTVALLARTSNTLVQKILLEDLEVTLPASKASIISCVESQLSSDGRAAFDAALDVAIRGAVAVAKVLLIAI